MITLKTRQFVNSILVFIVLLIVSWLSLVCLKEVSGISFQVSALSEPWMAGINPLGIKHSKATVSEISEIDRLKLNPISNNSLVMFMKSIRYGGINFCISKNSVAKTVGNSGKIQIKILLENDTTLNLNGLGYGKISLPYIPDIGLSLNSNAKFNLNPFSPEKPYYRIYGLGNIDFEGNLLAVSLDMSEGIHSRIKGSGKVSAFINSEMFEGFLLKK